MITLEDAAAHVRVELLYGVLEDYDLITRAVRIINYERRSRCVCAGPPLCAWTSPAPSWISSPLTAAM